MRIAQVAPLAEAVPPKLYGGTERVVSWLTEALVDAGHEVTLFAAGDSITSARLEAEVPCALRLLGVDDHLASHLLMVEHVRRRAGEFDLIHFHTDLIQFPLCHDFLHKTLTTIHGRLDLSDQHPLYRCFSKAPLVSISDDQRSRMPARCNWRGTIHHGLPPEQFTFSTRTAGYLAFLGRIAPEKRPDRAIEIAKRTGLPLKIAAKVGHADRDYFTDVIRPVLDGDLIEFVGEVNDSEKSAFLMGAIALLFPIDWCEPFGLVMIEAMAAGTPVIAWNKGSVPEVLEEGLTGFIVDSVDEAVHAVARATRISRSLVRRRFEERFTAVRMAEDYVEVYRDLIEPASSRTKLRKDAGLRGAPWPRRACDERPRVDDSVPTRSVLTREAPPGSRT